MYIGEKIKKIRETKGLTQAQLALKAGVGQAYISKIESQTIKEPPMSTIETIAMALGLSGRTLIEGTSFKPEVELARRKKGVGFCPNMECPGSNFGERREIIETATARGDFSPYLPPWEPYKTPLLDEDGDLISFCVHCGNKLITDCQYCGRAIKRFYKYCPGCGHLLFEQRNSPSEGESMDDDDVPF
jgi:transcriptional regulator with XRE-family HTH domain